ncbi:MAG: flagellar hook capping FlgD N-terminal domain-containing protein [Solirubrobacteraceae bacterium]
MTGITTTNPTVGAATTPTVGTTTAAAGSSGSAATSALGKDDFLRLMVTQLKRQDPMNPVDDTQFLAQMAQFSSLEQLTNLNELASSQLGATATGQALSLVGREVTYTAADGTVKDGVVEGVSFDGGNPLLTISGVAGISPSVVSAVRAAGVPTTPSVTEE